MWIAIGIVVGIILLFDISAIMLSGRISREEEKAEMEELLKKENDTGV